MICLKIVSSKVIKKYNMHMSWKCEVYQIKGGEREEKAVAGVYKLLVLTMMVRTL